MRREVRWSAHASHSYITSLTTLTQRNPALATKSVEYIDAALRTLSISPTGVPGAVPATYEYAVRGSVMIVYTLTRTTLEVVQVRFT